MNFVHTIVTKDIQYHGSCAKVLFPDLKEAYTTSIAVYSLISIIGNTILCPVTLTTSYMYIVFHVLVSLICFLSPHTWITAPQHLVCRVVPSLHINHMQMSIIEVFICRRLHMNTSMILICIWLICRLGTTLHTKCCGAVDRPNRRTLRWALKRISKNISHIIYGIVSPSYIIFL